MGARKDRPGVTAEKKPEIVRLLRQGVTRNAVAREVGCSFYAVDKAAKAEGISFDRTKTKAAVEARLVDLKAKRALIQERLLDAANESLDRFGSKYVVHAFVGGPAGGQFMKRTLPKPPAGDARSFMQAATYAIKAQLEIDARDGDNGAEGAKSMLGAIAAGLEAAAKELAGVSLE